MRWKLWRVLRPSASKHHAHRERRAVLALAQRAQIVGDALRQHRHDAVGEIDRVAALQRLAVERRAGPDIGRDIGDRDGDDDAAGVVRVAVGLGVDGVVMVLGVGRIDGDQRQVAPVLAARRASRAWLPRPRRAPPAGRRAECRGRGWRSVGPPSRSSASRARSMHLAARQAVAARAADRLDLDEIAGAWRRSASSRSTMQFGLAALDRARCGTPPSASLREDAEQRVVRVGRAA